MSESEYDDILTPDVRFQLIRKMESHKVISLAGPTLLDHEARFLEFHSVAGVILFERNVESLSQVNELIDAVRAQLGENAAQPIVMADHEGDFVAELRRIIGAPPSAMAIGATGDIRLAGDVARETGLAMGKLGVNVVLAPVADCCFDLSSPVTGLRTFGRDPERVSEFVGATIAGYRESGMITCAKHFPGHGSTPEDSHETLPEVRKSLDALRREDLIPFRRAVDDGVDMMMMSHVAYPLGGDSLVPASFDRRWIREILRDAMGFEGVVITDSLEMAGARWYARAGGGAFAGGFERALLAGADLLLHTRPIPESVEIEGGTAPVMSINVMNTIIRTLEKVVDQSRIDEKLAAAAQENPVVGGLLDLLESSSRRVASLRDRLAPSPEPARAPGSKVIAFDAYPSVPGVYRDAAERSVAVLRRADRFGGVNPDIQCSVIPVEWGEGDALKRQDLDAFIDVLCRRFPMWHPLASVVGFDIGPGKEITPKVRRGSPEVIDASRYTGEAPGGATDDDEPVVIVFSTRGVPPEDYLAGLAAFAEILDPAAVVVTGWPIADWVPETTPVLVTFGASSQAAAAAAQVLAGERVPEGSLDHVPLITATGGSKRPGSPGVGGESDGASGSPDVDGPV